MATVWLPAISSPTGKPRFADCSARRMSAAVTPEPAMRAGSSATITARPGPPTVCTSRVPGTRLRSASMLWATRSRSKAPVSASLLNSVRVTMGTSSMPLGLMMGSNTPKFLGSQSALERSVSCRRTSASVRGTPTLNCTAITAKPGRDNDITCSVPAICESTCSAGIATICSTSATLAPGNGISTLAMVTLIWGSSSRGVTSTAKAPSNKAIKASSGVMCARWNMAAMRPDTPRWWMDFISAHLCSSLGVGGDFVTGA